MNPNYQATALQNSVCFLQFFININGAINTFILLFPVLYYNKNEKGLFFQLLISIFQLVFKHLHHLPLPTAIPQ
jgi:hypothetical protein